MERLFGYSPRFTQEKGRVAEALDDDAVVMTMARTVLGGSKDAGRSSHQIKLDVCDKCRRGVQEGRGELVEVPPEVVEMAECDAQHIGTIPSRAEPHVEPKSAPPADAPSPKPTRTNPQRARQSIPPSVRRLVMRRDRSCCVVGPCKNGTFLDVHHVVPREEGGDHDPDRLAVLCGAHHTAVHAGSIVIEGCASTGFEFFRSASRSRRLVARSMPSKSTWVPRSTAP